MFASFNPVSVVDLTLITPNLIIQGSARTRIKRLTDLLSDPDSAHLALEDAKFIELGSRRILGSATVAQIPMQEVLMAYTAANTDGTAGLHMSKQPIRSTLLAPPFTIQGTIYLGFDPELRVALGGLADKWLPVTDARFWAYGVAEEPTSVDLIVVNRARAHLMVPKGVVWNPVPPANDGKASSNVW